MTADTFPILFLIARPAAGKSEIIHYLKSTPEPERRTRFHVGPFVELDDFPLLWAWFEEDRILERMGKPRVHTDSEENFLFPYLWDVLIERLGLEYAKLMRDRPDFHDRAGTVIVEFARGAEHGGFRQAFEHVPSGMLERGAILYVNVSWEESLRKNRARANPGRPDSILEHSLPDAKLEQLYRESDWKEFSSDHRGFITVAGTPIPYAVFENEDDVTTPRGEALGRRLGEVLTALWRRYSDLHNAP